MCIFVQACGRPLQVHVSRLVGYDGLEDELMERAV